MSTLSPRGQALVHAGRRAYQPTDADRARLLDQLRSQLGDAALPSSMSTASSAAAAGSATWPVISLVVIGVGILGGALYHAWPRAAQPDDQQRTKVASVAATPQAVEPVAVPASEQPTVTVAGPPPALPGSSASRPKDRLAAEVALLSRATRDLRAGHAAEALKALDEYRRRFPKGLLKDEHRAAKAQALCALGRFDEADAKIAELPARSPLAVRARQFCTARWARR